ncbi:MAG TPA: hypothetical protein VGV67_02110, partial [Solirubrobacteraceae bacterium]|nr:hypothetical protein [Solirubrobacteraceae bacterium]
LGLQFAVAGLVVAGTMFHWLRRRARSFAMLVEVETLLFSGVMFVTINDQLFGGFTPAAAAIPGDRLGDLGASDFLDRAPRLVGLWLDRTHGMLRWAPVIALAFYGLWLLWRSRRDHISRALPERGEVEIAAALCALVCTAQVLVATFIAPTMFGFFFPGRYLLAALPMAVALVAWGRRQAPRAGIALAVLTLVTSAWWYAELRIDGGAVVGPTSRAPLGPLDEALPLFGTGSAGVTVAVAAAGAGLVALLAVEWRSRRIRIVGPT